MPKDIKEILTARWFAINKKIQKISKLDAEKQILDLRARKILTEYLDRFAELSKSTASPKVYVKIEKLLNSLDYLVQIILKQGKKKRPLA